MTPHRTATGQTAASFVVIAAIVVSGLAFASTMNGPPRSTTGGVSQMTFYSDVSSRGLQLQIKLNSSEVPQGGALQAHIYLVNTLPESVTLHPDFAANPNIDSWNWLDYLCGLSPVGHTFGFALYEGHYTASNLSQAGVPLTLAPPVTSYCPNSGYAESYIENAKFTPNSDIATFSANSTLSAAFNPLTINMQLNATTGKCTDVPYQYTETNTVGGVVTTTTGTAYSQSCGSNRVDSLTGYWDPVTNCSPLFCFHQFPAGPYTIVAEDLWNQTAFGYFQVHPPSGSIAKSFTTTIPQGSSALRCVVTEYRVWRVAEIGSSTTTYTTSTQSYPVQTYDTTTNVSEAAGYATTTTSTFTGTLTGALAYWNSTVCTYLSG